MGYFKDAFDMIRLDDEAYLRVSVDEKALLRVVKLDLMTAYLLVLIVFMLASFLMIIFNYAIAQGETGTFMQSMWVLAGIAFFLPLLIVAAIYFSYLIPYHIGKHFGGEAKYNEFYKVVRYPQPIVGRLATMIGLGILPAVYHFVILYKTYMVIMRMEKEKAMKAVWWNVGIIGLLIALMVIVWVFAIFL